MKPSLSVIDNVLLLVIDTHHRLAERRGRAKLEQGLVYEAQESFELAGQLVRRSKLTEQQREVFRQGLKTSLEGSSDQGNRENIDQIGGNQAELPHLSEPHPSLPGLTGQAEVRHSCGRGRHTVAASRIEAGQVVAR